MKNPSSTEYRDLPLSNLIESATNPRRIFDWQALPTGLAAWPSRNAAHPYWSKRVGNSAIVMAENGKLHGSLEFPRTREQRPPEHAPVCTPASVPHSQ